MIPGARGCTPQACAFRDHHRELADLRANVFGLSTQSTAYQAEMAGRLHLPFPVLSDERLLLADALGLPTFEVDGMRLLRRPTMVLRRGTVEAVFHPVTHPERNTGDVVAWLAAHPGSRARRESLAQAMGGEGALPSRSASRILPRPSHASPTC